MRAMVRPLLLVAALTAAQTLAAQVQWTGQSHPELLASNGPNAEASASGQPAKLGTSNSGTVNSTASTAAATTNTAATADPHAPVLPPPDSLSEQPIPGEAAADASVVAADFGVVTRVPHNPGELAVGTVLRTRLDDVISSATTPQGSEFSAQIVRDVVQDGKVIVPTGSTLLGRVTKVVENRRFQGRCKLRLRPDEIILPDGSHLIVHAQVIDTDAFTDTRADGEGTITSRDNSKKYWTIAGATTTSGMVGGAIVGGGVGAVVGAAIGAGVGATHYMMSHPSAELPRRSVIVFELTEAMPIIPLHSETLQTAPPDMPVQMLQPTK